MPSLYTHYLFGQKALPLMPARIRGVAQQARGPFNLGLQGPDFFFYGSVLRDGQALAFGTKLHDLPVKDTLERILKGFQTQYGQPMGGLVPAEMAYLVGFLGHFSLDAMCHPYIYKIQQTDANHLALETDFDSFWLRREGKKPHRARVYRCCPADALTRAAAVKAYGDWADEISPERVSMSVADLRLVRRLMRTPDKVRFGILRSIMEKKGIYETQFGMLTPPPTKENPQSITWPGKPADSIETLERLFEEGLPFYIDNITKLLAVIEDGAPWPEVFNRNFVD